MLLPMAAGQAVAALLGSIVCIVPTAAFAVCANRWRKPGAILLAGALKPVTIVGLMAAVFVLAKPPALGFFGGLAAVHLAYLAVPLLDRGGRRGERRKTAGLKPLNS